MRRILWALALGSGALCAAMSPEARQSFSAFEHRAETGDPAAMYRLSAILETGYDSIAPDTVRSLALLHRSAATGYAPAENYLGYLYMTGAMTIPQDADSARYWVERAAMRGYPGGSYNLAHLLLQEAENTDSTALIHLRRAADARLPQALTLLADLKAEGRRVERDSAGAADLYEKAINAKFPDAELKLLNLIGPGFSGYTSEKKLSEAMRYMRLGAPIIGVELLQEIVEGTPESARAYALLGHAYSRALGVEYDHRKANEYFARAAALGNPSAQFIIAETLDIFPDAFSDLGVTLPTAAELRASAAEAGIMTAEQAVAALTAP